MNKTNICPLVYPPNSKFNNINGSIKYYNEQARKHIQKYLPTAIKGTRTNLKLSQIQGIIRYSLSNDDIFNSIVTAIMIADSTWDKDRSSLTYWRSQNCMWTLNKIFYKNKKRMFTISNKNLPLTPLEDAIAKEEQAIIEAKIDALSKRTKQIINLYYKENRPEREIADIFAISQQRVCQILTKAKKQLQNG